MRPKACRDSVHPLDLCGQPPPTKAPGSGPRAGQTHPCSPAACGVEKEARGPARHRQARTRRPWDVPGVGSGPGCTCHHCPSAVRPHGPSRRPWDTAHSLSTLHPVPLTLGLSAHLDTRLALAFPLGLSSKVTSSERPPRTAASKPAPLSPHPLFDFYFFPAPGTVSLNFSHLGTCIGVSH